MFCQERKFMTLEKRDLSQLLETAIVAARLAGQHAMEEINFTKASLKNGNEMVTQADIRCQQIIIDQIKQRYPDHGFIAEEGKDGKLFKLTPRGDSKIYWVIDPIDGTNNFAHRMLSFAVSIAAMLDGQTIAAAIYEPATDSMFTAVKDGDAQLNSRRITVSDSEMTQFTCVGIESYYEDKTPDWVSNLMNTTRVRCLGTTAMHLAYTAKGSFIATTIVKPKLWDIAAGAFIAKTAGALITDSSGNDIFPLNVENYDGGPIPTIAANKKIHPKLLELINS